MTKIVETFDDRATKVLQSVSAFGGKAPNKKLVVAPAQMSYSDIQAAILTDMKSAVNQLNALRAGSPLERGIDLSFAEYSRDKWGFGFDEKTNIPHSLYQALGVSFSHSTVEQLFTMPEFEEGFRWLVPEIFREAIRTGLRRNPIYGDLIASEETISQMQLIMPSINMSNATPKKIGEAESTPMGQVSFEQKTVRVDKIGMGIKMTDEVIRFSTLSLLSIFLQDLGVKLGIALTTEAIDTLINGDQAGGTDACAVIGTQTINAFAYRDLLRAWIRMGRIGRLPAGMLSNEDPALDILELPEFKALAGTGTLKQIEVRTPVPQSQAFWIHGAMASLDQVMLIDPTSALIKLNAQPLKVESERIAERQINGTYVTLMTGYATLFRDARLIIDRSMTFASQGFPSFFDVGTYETEAFQ